MTSGSSRILGTPTRIKLFFLVTGPLLVLLAFGVGNLIRRGHSPESLSDEGQRRLIDAFAKLLDEAERVTAGALDTPPQARSGVMGARLEGAALVGADQTFVRWRGTPSELPEDFEIEEAPRWLVRLDGLRTRLLVLTTHSTGETILGSFVLDSSGLDDRLPPLLAGAELDAFELTLRFIDSEAFYGDPLARRPESADDLARSLLRDDDGARPVMLRSSAGAVLAVADLRPADPRHRRQQHLATGRAWAVGLFLALLVLLFDWQPLGATPRRFAMLAGTVVVARVLLIVVRFPAAVSRELGSASLYGTSSPFRLLASPLDLLLTAGAIYLVCIGLRNLCGAVRGKHPRGAAAVALVASLPVVLAALGIGVSVARDSRLLLTDRPALFEADAGTLLLVALVLTALGGAELIGCALTIHTGAAGAAGRIRVALSLIVVAALSSVVLQWKTQSLALERLRSEYLPQTLEQSSRRRLALNEAVRFVQDAFGARDPETSIVQRPEFLAYRFWSGGELDHAGYKSSLAFYTPSGARVSHFGFDLPPFGEKVYGDSEELTTFEERYNPISGPQDLIHAEMPVLDEDGQRLGIVVGHVLDEPDNLPFLPWTRSYLIALGAGPPGEPGQDIATEYVLYDEFGTVRVSTLPQPPVAPPSPANAGETPRTVVVRAGDESYRGLAATDRGRVHLLLIPEREFPQQLASGVRLVLLALSLLLLTHAPRLLRVGGAAGVIRQVRRSFYRKLLATLLIASVLPLVGLALLLRGYIERQGERELREAAIQYAAVAQRVLEDYGVAEPDADQEEPALNDNILYWLRDVVGQEIHVYDNGVLQATSKRELFSSGLLPRRMDGQVHKRLATDGLPYLVQPARIGPTTIPVAYATVRSSDPHRQLVVAVPVVQEQQQIARAVNRVQQVILLATVLLVVLLALAAAWLARTVARPVRELVRATAEIAAGDYAVRLEPYTRDELADLVGGFNSMASALSRQRADLERRRAYMERLLRHATTAVISTDADGRVVTLNPAASELLASDETGLAIGEDLAEGLERSTELSPLAQLIRSVPERRNEPQEIDLVRGQEARRYRLVRIELSDPSDPRPGRLLLLDDVTDLMRSNQLAAWAEMARAIAHEIKNPLTPIQLSAEHLRRLLRDRGVLPAPQIEVCLETVLKQVRSLHEIAGEFSAYAKLPVLDPQPSDPVAFMRQAIGPYRAGCPPGVTIHERYENAGQVAIDRKVLSRAVINLIENALQAMPDGGELTVAVHPVDGASEVALAVIDSGAGLDPEVKRRLFEPYFSTKSHGTGLGLAIVRRAVEAHHGTIDVESEPGRGTTVRIRLPGVDGNGAAGAAHSRL